MSNPCLLAREIAEIIKNDAVMARQIKEHIKPDDLADLLEIARPVPPFDIEEECPSTLEEAQEVVFNSMALEDILAAHRTRTK